MSEWLASLPGSDVFRGFVAAALCFAMLALLQRSLVRQQPLRLGGLLAFGLAALGLGASLAVTATNIVAPREWDFLCFWTFGKALALGQSPYDVDLLRELAAPHQPGDEFWRETYCLYPPPCVVQFLPLGWFSISAAAALWNAVQWAAAIGSTLLLWRLLDQRRRLAVLIVSAALVVFLRASISTFWFAQTNFVLLFLALLAMQTPSHRDQGLALGLATAVKPIGAIFALDLLVRRQWRSLATSLIPLLAGLLIFLLLQGTEGLRAYLQRNPLAEDIAAGFYTETMNQSLLAWLLRLSGRAPGPRPVFFGPFLLTAGVLTAATLIAAWRRGSQQRELTLGSFVALALLVYPGSLRHYSVLLVAPLVALWRAGGPRMSPWSMPVIVWAGAFGLVWAKAEFFANLIVWLVCVVRLSTVQSAPAAVETAAIPTQDEPLPSLQRAGDEQPRGDSGQ